MATHKRRIGTALYIILVVGAAIADGVQALLKLLWLTVIFGIIAEGISWFVTGAVMLTYGLIFTMNKVSLLHRKNAMRFVLTGFIEMLPILSAIPSLTIWTVGTVRQSRKEDAERAAEEKKAAETQRNARMKMAQLRARQEQVALLNAQAIAAAAAYQASATSRPSYSGRYEEDAQGEPSDEGQRADMARRAPPDQTRVHNYTPPVHAATANDDVAATPFAGDVRRIAVNKYRPQGVPANDDRRYASQRKKAA